MYKFFMKKINEEIKRNRTLLGKINNIVFSSGVYYNANTTCVSYYFPHYMCSTTMGSSAQVKYINS